MQSSPSILDPLQGPSKISEETRSNSDLNWHWQLYGHQDRYQTQELELFCVCCHPVLVDQTHCYPSSTLDLKACCHSSLNGSNGYYVCVRKGFCDGSQIRIVLKGYRANFYFLGISSGSGVRDFIFLIAKIWRNEGALKPTKNITMGKIYIFYDHFNNYWVNLCADARFFLSLKFRKFYLLKIQFLAIFNCHLGALRVFFRKNVRKQTPP